MNIQGYINQDPQTVNTTWSSMQRKEIIEYLTTESFRIMYEAERVLMHNYSYNNHETKPGIKVFVTLANATLNETSQEHVNVTKIASYLNLFKYYTEGVMLTPVAILGLFGKYKS